MPKKTVPDAPVEETKTDGEADVLEEGLLLDYITQKLIKETPKNSCASASPAPCSCRA
jgi:hypothetical protein